MFSVQKSTNIFKNVNKLLLSIKHFSTKNCKPEEVRILVPWGHLAGKWWGRQDQRPILTVHGWQDNCGSFDTLIPLLNRSSSFLAIDFPGHGLSSQLPTGAFYHWADYVIVIKRIVNYFEWHKVSLMGHSLGGFTSFLYTIMYPDTVDFLICFDALKPAIFDPKKIPNMGKDIDDFIKYDYINSSNKEPPCYSSEELEMKLHSGSAKSISLNVCKHILQRGMVPSSKEPNKFYYKRDARLKILSLLDYDEKQIVNSASKLKCPTILCLAKYGTHMLSRTLEGSNDLYESINKYNKNFEIHHVEGSHHMHLNNPERLEGLVNAFIKKFDVEDRSVGGIKEEIKIETCS